MKNTNRFIMLVLSMSLIMFASCKKDNNNPDDPNTNEYLTVKFNTGTDETLTGTHTLIESGDSVKAGETHYLGYTISCSEAGRMEYLVMNNTDTLQSYGMNLSTGSHKRTMSFVFNNSGNYTFILSFTSQSGKTASDTLKIACAEASIEKFFGIFVADSIRFTYQLDDTERTIMIPVTLTIEHNKNSVVPETTLTIFDDDYNMEEVAITDSFIGFCTNTITVAIDTITFNASLSNFRISYSHNNYSLRGSLSQQSMPSTLPYRTFSAYFLGYAEKNDEK